MAEILKNATTLTVTKKNDKINIQLGSGDNYIIPASKGKDSLNFSFATNKSGGDFEYKQLEDTKDLVISYTKGNTTDTITIKNYFKTVDGNSTASSVKTVTIDDKTYNLTDLYQYSGEFVPNKKRSVSGTVFSDVIDESIYRNDREQGLTIKSGDGNDIITGSRFNDTIVSGRGNNTIILKDNFGDDKLVTTKGETVNINFDGNASQLEYVLDGKNVKAVANLPDTSCYLEGLVGISKPMLLSDGTYCTINSTVNGKTITIYDADQVGSNGKLITGAQGSEYINNANPYTRYSVVEENGEYKWKSENILQGVPGNKELYLYTEPTLSLLYEDKLDDMWMPDDGSYMLLNSNIYKVKDNNPERINISEDVVEQLKDDSYNITDFLFKKGLNGSVSISNMALTDLKADVLVNGTNIEDYLSTEGHLNVTGSGRLTGTRFNDKFTGSALNDVITGKGGNNIYEIDTSKDFGDDTIVLTNGETMTLDFNKYQAENLKYELINGGKDIKISSYAGDITSTSFEVRGMVHPLYISTSEGDIITDDIADPIEVVFKVVEENGKYKWMSDNILKTLAPDADPITFTLPLGVKDGAFKDYLYETEDMMADDYVMVTVDEIHVWKTDGGVSTDISADVIQQIENGTYNTESFNDTILNPFDGTVTIKNFGQKDLGAILNIGDTNLAEYLSQNGIVEVSGKKTITATRFNDNITGSISADKIYAYAGNDTINAKKGNDKIYLGEGEKTLSFTSGDGNDIIYSANKANSVNLEITNADNIEYSKKGDSLVITRTDNDGKTVNNKAVKKLYITADGDLSTSKKGNTRVGKTLYSYEKDGTIKYSTTAVEGGTDISGRQFFIQDGKIVLAGTHKEALSETTTIDGYFKNELPNIIVNGDAIVQDGLLDGQILKYGSTLDYKKAQTFKGTDLYEEFVGGKGKDKIHTGAGNDTVTAGRSNDTIYLNGKGEKTVNFVKGDGNDTIYMNYDGVKANLVFEDCVNPSDGEVPEDKGQLIYGRKGNDLYIVRDYGSVKTEQVTTVKNYFNNTTTSELSINGEKFNPNKIVFEYIGSGKITFEDGNNYEVITGRKTDTITLSNGDFYSVDSGAGNDKITISNNKESYIDSGSGNDTVTITGTGNNTLNYTSGRDYYSVGEGNDIYNVEFGRKSDLIISDNGGNDVLNINSDNNNLTYLFDVDKNGNITDDTSLLICDTDSLKISSRGISGGCIEIIDYFKTGEIETINVNSTELNLDTDAIASAVSTWLSDPNHSYDSAMDVMNSGNKEDIASLLAIYQPGA